MRTWQSKCAAWRKRAILCKNHRPGNGNTQACVLPRALLGFCTAPRNPLLKRHCGGGNKLVCCQRPHLFSQQLTAQSLVCSQIKHGKELLSQFRTIDCLVRRAAHARRTIFLSLYRLLGGVPFGTLLCNRRSYICFRQAISRSLAVPYSAFSQGSFKSIICAHIHIHTRTHGLFYTRIINP